MQDTVVALAREVLSRAPVRAVIVERDANIPAELEGELCRIP